MASFQTKLRGEMPRKGENKNYRSVPFQPNASQKIPKKKEKIKKKLKKMPLWLHLKPKQVGKGRERWKTKIIVPFRSYQTRNRKFKKKKKKNFENLRIPLWLNFKP